MASNGMSTAGMTLSYAAESTAGTRPSTASAWTKIPEVKTFPSFNPSPSTIDITPLDEEEFVLYTQGLKDMGGALEFTANLTNELIDVWQKETADSDETASVVKSYEDGLSENKALWFMIQHPKLTNAVFFKGEPGRIGLNETSVNSALETTLYITPHSAPEWGTKPTASGG